MCLLQKKQPRNGSGNGNGSGFDHLSTDLVMEILRRLDAELLWWSCRRVCTRWNNVISSPSFRQLHLQQPSPCTFFAFYLQIPTWKWPRNRDDNSIYFFPRDRFFSMIPRDDPMRRVLNGSLVQHWKNQIGTNMVRPVASCNGLVLFRIESSSPLQFYIGNPITGELLTVQYPFKGAEFHGFFYHSSMQQYKLLLCHKTEHSEDNPFEYAILNLGSTKWRTLRALPYRAVNGSSPVILDNTLYWMIADSFSTCDNSIMMFSTDSQVFGTMSHPSYPCQTTKAHNRMSLLEMEGRLTCWFFIGLVFLVWVFEDDDVGGHWTRIYDLHFNLTFNSYIPPGTRDNSNVELVSIQNKELLLHWRRIGVFRYNLSTYTVEKVLDFDDNLPGFDKGHRLLSDYTKTLVSLCDLYPYFSKFRAD